LAAGLSAAALQAGPPDAAAGSGPSAASTSSTGDIRSLLAALKLPGGELSASILSFAKFFSLPLDASFLRRVRQGALAGQDQPPVLPGKTVSPASGFQFQEALALAALASAAKGLELDSRALAAYARALLHGQVPQEDGDGSAGEAESPETPAGEEGNGKGHAAGGKGAAGGKEGPRREIPGISPAGIRKPALAAQGPLLGILNRLPGKDGKRWIVLPFSLEGLDICLRVLLAGSRVELMGLDMRGGEGIWRFIFRPGDPPAAEQDFPWSLELCQFPVSGEEQPEVLREKLAEFLGLSAGKIRICRAPVFAESRDWILPSVNKEV
jgi:hypothetical protein